MMARQYVTIRIPKEDWEKAQEIRERCGKKYLIEIVSLAINLLYEIVKQNEFDVKIIERTKNLE